MVGESLVLLAAHLVADFPLQTDWMARDKFDDWIVRADHVMVHGAVMIVAMLLIGRFSFPFVLAYCASHFVIDTRRWAEEKEGIGGYPIIVDQVLHVTVLAVLAIALL